MNESDLSKITWRKRGRWERNILFDSLVAIDGESTTYAKKVGYGFVRDSHLSLDVNYYETQDDWDATYAYVKKSHEADSAFLDQHGRDCFRQAQSLITYSETLKTRDVRPLTNAQLTALFQEYGEQNKLLGPFLYSVHPMGEYMENVFRQMLQKFIETKKLSKEFLSEALIYLTVPEQKIFSVEEPEDLLAIACEAQKSVAGIHDPSIQQRLRKHYETYRWMNIYCFANSPHEFSHYEKRLTDILADDPVRMRENLQKQKEEQKKKTAEVAEVYRDAPDILAYAKTIRFYGYLRSFRIDAFHIAWINAIPLLEEISNRLHVADVPTLGFFTEQEIVDGLAGGPMDITLAKERQTDYVWVKYKDEWNELAVGERAKQLKQIIHIAKAEKTDRAKGNTAYPGKVTGRAKILLSLADMTKMERGDILVISMTDPNYLPAMEKAAAFVTDQGGILCHAAVVAREMKKPCVIGTKIATQIFSDNDIIEVNADEGIVRKCLE